MGPVLLLPPVAEVLVHPPAHSPPLLDRPLPSTPPSSPPPTGPRALAHLDGHERGYLQHVLSRRPAKALPPPPRTPTLLPRYQHVFLCPARIAGRLCDLLKPGRHVITLLGTKNSRQPVFFGGGGREGRRKTI